MDNTFSDIARKKAGEAQEVILFHGFEGKRLNAIIDTLKRAGLLTRDTILAATTDQSIHWTVKELIGELSQEHAWFKKKAEERATTEAKAETEDPREP